MALYWEPRWVRKKFIVDGMEIITCQDVNTKMYICPICVDIDKVCPEGKETSIVSEDMVTFFTLKDLVNHMRSHGLEIFSRKIVVKKEEGKKGHE